MSQEITLARPYARAAFAIARDRGELAGWSKALAFSARVAADPRVAPLLGHPDLSDADAVELLASGDATAEQRELIALLAANGRLGQLAEIAGLYEDLRAAAENVVRATVTSAAELSDDEVAGIRAALERRFGSAVEVERAVDPELIGGAVISAGDVVIDGSLRGKLARMQSALGA